MAKNSSIFKCDNCGAEYTKEPFGKCRKCGAFGQYSTVSASSSGGSSAGLKTSGAARPTKKASTISDLNSKPINRIATGIEELDRVLGGGFVDGEVVLFSGFPGAGKSSLSLSIADRFANMGKKVLYSSGEESEQQIGLRAQRMNVSNDNILIVNETSLETLLGYIEEIKPEFLIVDSLQTIASSEITGSVGSISQSKEAAHVLTRIAKTTNVIMVLISQVSKTGDFSGSESIQHIVDATLSLESDPDTPLKFLRATKNRFGDTVEVGVFQHQENGLMEVSDPSGILLDNEDSSNLSGTSTSFVSEGVRQIPVEIQALVTSSNMPNPRKQFNGVDYNRGQIVCAILDKFCNARLYDNDVFVSTVSGIKVKDPLADLSIAASVISSAKDKKVTVPTAFVGELSLTGQVRGSFMIDNKIREAQRLGFQRIVVPKSAQKNIHVKGMSIQIEYISFVNELTKFLK